MSRTKIFLECLKQVKHFTTPSVQSQFYNKSIPPTSSVITHRHCLTPCSLLMRRPPFVPSMPSHGVFSASAACRPHGADHAPAWGRPRPARAGHAPHGVDHAPHGQATPPTGQATPPHGAGRARGDRCPLERWPIGLGEGEHDGAGKASGGNVSQDTGTSQKSPLAASGAVVGSAQNEPSARECVSIRKSIK